MSRPKKVNFNQQLATEAVDALNTLSAQLRKFQQMENGPRTSALKDWRGPDADQFTGRVPWITGQAANLITAIGGTIRAIEEGASAAKTQNAKASG